MIYTIFRLLIAVATSRLVGLANAPTLTGLLGLQLNQIAEEKIPLETSSVIWPSGGYLQLGRVRLIVPNGAIKQPTVIRLKRIPANIVDSSRHSIDDCYTAYPINLTALGMRPFVLYWYLEASEVSNSMGEIICPMVSWTENGELPQCYSYAGMPLNISKLFDDTCDFSGRKLRLGDSDITLKMERDLVLTGCKTNSAINKTTGEIIEYEFLTSRLGHFKLMPRPKTKEEKIESATRKPGDIYLIRGSYCRYRPDNNRWIVNIDMIDSICWQLGCQSLDDCPENDFCWRLDEQCEMKIGFCKSRPIDCANSISEQVCGCNGKTYPNPCEAYRNAVSIKKLRPCE